MKDFAELIDLASERLGGLAIEANDEFFAPIENLLKSGPAIFIEDKYTLRGKWMDGWETRRRRTPGHDWCIIKLGVPGIIRGIVVDTSYFKGNYPSHCSLDACSSEACEWIEILPKSELRGDTQNPFPIESTYCWTHIRLNIYPDGGVARLRVYGDPIPDTKMLFLAEEIDLAAVENGGVVIDASDMFFGSRHNLIMPGRSASMRDGWETRRRRGPGNDWTVIQLAGAGTIHRVEVDTSHFKGNFPESCSLEGTVGAVSHRPRSGWSETAPTGDAWQELLPRTKLEADKLHVFEKEVQPIGALDRVRFNIFPDGGVARLRLFGHLSAEGRAHIGLVRLNSLWPSQAETKLLSCCGSKAWATQMAARRPFANTSDLMEAAGEIWWKLRREDWLEAFRAHPKIGEKTSARWPQEEQAGVERAGAETLVALGEANAAYESRFGYIFIVCATGKTPEEMLALLGERLQNDADKELRVAAEEQLRITQLRLEKLLTT